MKFLIKMAAVMCMALPTALLCAQITTTAKPKPSATASAPATAPVKAVAPATAAPLTSGGAPKVWVNTDSNVYHCPGTRYYGKTKDGKYMTEAQAKAAKATIAKGQNCSK